MSLKINQESYTQSVLNNLKLWKTIPKEQNKILNFKIYAP